MDKLVFYKKGKNLKESLSQIRVSYTRPYSMSFAADVSRLTAFLSEYESGLLYYFTDDLSKSDRVLLRNIESRFPSFKICLCTNKAFALDAWKLNVFHFEEHPVAADQICNGYKKYIQIDQSTLPTLDIKMDSGLVKIHCRHITYLQASGNYTIIHMVKDRQIIQTKQLQHFQFLEEQDPQIRRVHRSFIINLRNIKTISKSAVSFYGSEKVLEISQSLAIKLKKIILGKL